MNAQEKWKQKYSDLFEVGTIKEFNLIRNLMYDIRREAALERKLEAAEARAADLQTRLVAMHSEYDQAMDEWERCVEEKREQDEAINTLRATVEEWIDLWSYICKATNCLGYLPNDQNFDSMLDNAPRYVDMRASFATLKARCDELTEMAIGRDAEIERLHNAIEALTAQNAEQARRLSELIPLATELVNALGYWLNLEQEPQECVSAELALGAWLAVNVTQTDQAPK